ncbi:hypothetical protein A3715_05790 [Oleiphilus sp. HI0009]|nr:MULTISPECIES: DUF3750 domain-containing protein [unclassified Oleiphilus]KZX82797.1 hypothetical protein A3715_05790 [Oleiphilus sp. HI0009]MCH2157567.1 DUF3750 domain-containing protein [Oleiphilaceae bacterium]KZY61448.1 hypothetical protein A3738_13875 [Oleiphilus sp. HI0066]KZY75836.1 hypothetical protein A3739_23960 [Oleiphilus sp. HI0067]KZY76908.1 hypothetical protein A3739_13795 [Oleiphilus sp. HI0067]
MRSIFTVLVLSLGLVLTGCSTGSWRDASRDSANLSPLPGDYSDAIVQVYAADAWGWRGIFAVHTWISVKPSNADQYTVLEVIGWRARWGVPVLRIEKDLPDRYWFGAKPELVYEKRGEGADQLIEDILRVSRDYPWANEYTVFPGPNSNTYPAWVASQIEGFELDMPFRAIGSGWEP